MHWSNEDTMIQYIVDIFVPFVARVHDTLHCSQGQAALAIFDCFKGQLAVLEDNNIHSVIVPANCTDYLQPLDLTVNKVAKSYFEQQFSEWYANEVSNQILSSSNDGTTLEPVDLFTARM